MNCQQCGAVLAPGNAFCGSCGSPVAVQQPPQYQQPAPPPPPAPTPYGAPHGLIILVIGGVMIAVWTQMGG